MCYSEYNSNEQCDGLGKTHMEHITLKTKHRSQKWTKVEWTQKNDKLVQQYVLCKIKETSLTIVTTF